MSEKDSLIIHTVKSPVYLREKSSIKSKALVTINEGDTVKVIDSIDSWYSVTLIDQGLNGFVGKKFLIKEKVLVERTAKNNVLPTYIIGSVAILILLLIIVKQAKKLSYLRKDLTRFKPILDVEKELNKIKKAKEKEISKIESNRKKLNEEYLNGKIIFEDLLKKTEAYKSEYEFIENGIYIPVFDFGTSEDFKSKIIENKNLQKQLIRNKQACICTTEWSVSGSRREGKKMTNRQIKLALRAFNGECDSIISKVNWNNVNRIKDRINKSFEMLNRLNEPNHTYITDDFLKLKIKELNLTHEYRLKLQEEKEKQREIRAAQREEEKARRDFEKAEKEALQKEKIFKKALEEARKELGLASKDEVKALEHKINDLQSELDATLEKFERAKSMAQQTKRGHVYVVSNIGSFGQNIYKIGMTRRLDPIDRVKELGDASVPFRFDLHAMIYTEDAPKLESLLHKKFDDHRINKVNNRKEYFNVTLEEIKDCIEENFDGEFDIIKEVEAKEYNESLFLNKKKEDSSFKISNDKFPDNLF